MGVPGFNTRTNCAFFYVLLTYTISNGGFEIRFTFKLNNIHYNINQFIIKLFKSKLSTLIVMDSSTE